MHSWGDWPDENFDAVDDAAYFIGGWLRKWGRVPVRQTKEKYGMVRVYCGLGWDSFHDIFYSGHCFFRWAKWMVTVDLFICHKLHFSWILFNLSYPIHKILYRWRYKKAIEKWPTFREEILCCADFSELLKDL